MKLERFPSFLFKIIVKIIGLSQILKKSRFVQLFRFYMPETFLQSW